jgi:endonuclease/exonuclease/phosphatase family metal-dependent hydrolase
MGVRGGATATSARPGAVLAALLAAVVLIGGLVAVAVAGLVPAGEAEPEPEARQRVARLEGRELAATIRVVSQNVFHDLGRADTQHDMSRILGRGGVDVVGWQEAHTEHFVALHPRYRAQGWRTAYFDQAKGSQGDAISWRSDRFALVSRDAWAMHPGAGPRATQRPFAARWVTTVLLRHRESGLTVRVVNTHVNHFIETGQRFRRNINARYAKAHIAWLAERWDTWSGDVVIGTGDYNFDHADDRDARPRGGISRQFEDRAVSSYEALGLDGVQPTLAGRWVDYVLLARRTLDEQRAQLAAHRSLGGFRSDHRPLQATVRLYR